MPMTKGRKGEEGKGSSKFPFGGGREVYVKRLGLIWGLN